MKVGALRGSLTPHLPHPPPGPTSSPASSPWMPCPLPPALWPQAGSQARACSLSLVPVGSAWNWRACQTPPGLCGHLHPACFLPWAHVLGRELDIRPPPGGPTDLEKAEGHLPELLNRGAPSGFVKQHQFPPGGHVGPGLPAQALLQSTLDGHLLALPEPAVHLPEAQGSAVYMAPCSRTAGGRAPGLSPARPTCWPGAEERQVLHSTCSRLHRSWQMEPEMMPLRYWSHWGEQGDAGSGPGKRGLHPRARQRLVRQTHREGLAALIRSSSAGAAALTGPFLPSDRALQPPESCRCGLS